MPKPLIWILLVISAAGIAWWLSVQRDMQAVDAAAVSPPPFSTSAPAELIEYPIEQVALPSAPQQEPDPVTAEVDAPEPQPDPLPSLANSDEEVLSLAEGLVGEEALNSLWVKDYVISRLVATVDSLTSERVAPLMLPIQAIPGRFKVLEAGDAAAISPENAQRYDPYVNLLETVPAERLLAPYVRYYPLFQEAYEAQGVENVYFNDRLVDVIDHLLATPQPAGLIEVVQNEAVYDYVDQDLQALSAGQKALLRLNKDQSDLVRQRLREFRSILSGVKLSEAAPATVAEEND